MSWESWEDTLEAGPGAILKRVIPILLVLVVGFGVFGYVAGWFTEAAQVAKEEFGPRASLEKYEWFKDAASTLDKKRADIEVYQSRMKMLESAYPDMGRGKWPREDREQFNVWSSELAGIRASYNSLAAEYNAAMAKFNWAFANAGDLPRGAEVPLPREFKPYTGGDVP